MKNPGYLLEKDIVFVTLSYRLGPLGFMSTEDDVLPGNNGLKDQQLALKWVKDNIQNFGGNPNSITLMGQSSGAISVHLHYLSAKSRGLFHRGYALSGAVLASMSKQQNARGKAEALSTACNCTTTTTRAMINCLKQVPISAIVNANRQFYPYDFFFLLPFSAVIEPEGINSFLTADPFDLIRSGNVYDVPLVTTITGQEYDMIRDSSLSNNDILSDLNNHWDKLAPIILEYKYTVDDNLKPEVSRRIREFYLHDKNITKETLPKVTEMGQDRAFGSGIEKTMLLMGAMKPSPTYFLRMNYHAELCGLSSLLSFSNTSCAVSHGDDLPLYKVELMKMILRPDDRVVQRKVLHMLWNYMDTSEVVYDDISVTPVSKQQNGVVHLLISGPTEAYMETNGTLSHRFFWDSLLFKDNNPLDI